MDALTLEKHLKKSQTTSAFIAFLGSVFVAVGSFYAVYYKIINSIDLHTTQINVMQTQVNDITDAVNNTAVFQGSSKVEIKALQDQIGDVKNSQSRIEDKLDKLIMRK